MSLAGLLKIRGQTLTVAGNVTERSEVAVARGKGGTSEIFEH